MKTCKFSFFLFLSFLLSAGSLSSQSLTQQLGGVPTTFSMVWEGEDLSIESQAIFKRGKSRRESDWSPASEYGYGLGYGLEVYRLECIIRQEVPVITGRDTRKMIYQFSFDDAQENVLLRTRISARDVTYFRGDGPFSVISIDLQNVPIIILDRTKNIKVTIVSQD